MDSLFVKAAGAVLATLVAATAPALAQTATGVPADIAAGLRAIGPVVNPPAVYKLYDPLLAVQDKSGVTRTDDQPYGPDARHKVDVYAPSATPAAPAPVAIFLHGGGFVRGDKSERANIGYFLARNGVVALIPSYRLAPAAVWPSGPEDVVRLLQWAKDHVTASGGDPKRIFPMGESAGAAHVAAAAFMARFHPPGGLGAAGVILFSGVYDVDLETRARVQFGVPTPDPRNDAYFGADRSRFAAMSTALNVTAPAVPTLLAYSELDPAQMQTQAGEMFAALCRAWTQCPDLRVFLDHDHVSPGSSFNTPDTSVTGPVLAFIRSH